MTSTSSKIAALLTGAILIAGIASASHYYGDSNSITADTGFSIPHYDSQEEILTELVAPFLLIAIVFQIGLQRALMFTLDEDRNNWMGADPQYEKEKKKI